MAARKEMLEGLEVNKKKHASYFQILQQIQKKSDTNMADQLPYSFQEVEATLFCYGDVITHSTFLWN